MREVFILGAGFSKAIHGSMPLLEELSTKISSVEKLPPPLATLGNDVELWLTYLSQPQPWLKEFHNLENRALFLRIGQRIGETLEASTSAAVCEDGPDWLHQLVTWWHKNRSAVITLNYDTLVERAALKAGIDPEEVYPVRLTDIRRASTFGADPESSFRLFKLHGSVNWYYSGAASFHGEVLYYGRVTPWGEPLNKEERQSISAARDKVPLIVPPTTEKVSYFQHETLRQVWLGASQALAAASSVYCVGYSLPTTDLGVRFFLHHSRPGEEGEKVPLFVVNRSNSPQELVGRYQHLLGNSYAIKDKYASTGAESLVDVLNETSCYTV